MLFSSKDSYTFFTLRIALSAQVLRSLFDSYTLLPGKKFMHFLNILMRELPRTARTA